MPSSRVLTFTDPDSYQAAIRAAQVEILVTTRGKFRAELTQINFHRLWMQRGYESLSRVFHSAVSTARAPIVFLTDANQAAMHHSGMEVSSSDIIVDGLGSIHHHRSSGPCHWGAMSLTPKDLAAAGISLAGRELTVPSVTYRRRPNPALMSRLLNLHEIAERLAKTSPDILASPEVARGLEQTLLHAMISCLTDGTPVVIRHSAHQHSRVIARFEESLAANASRPLYVAEICAATGVSERTLQVCCHDFLGMSPMRYLSLRRIHLARRALLLADPKTATVTAIATEFGFWELGRFSVEYRALFGESPLMTLRRPPQDQSPRQDNPFALPVAEFA